MVACFGRQSLPIFRRLPDFSRGMYLIAFPTQQLIVFLSPHLAHPIVTCALASAAIGLLCWCLVDRPVSRFGRSWLAADSTPNIQKMQSGLSCERPKSIVSSARNNNFDALRVFAALLVIYGHGCYLVGGADPGLWGLPIARLGLDVFFSISGFLITSSWDRDPNPRSYFAKRVLRIFPGLIACVLATVFVMGSAASSLSVRVYLSDPSTYAYLNNIALYSVQHLPGVFEPVRHDSTVNGSLWSLFPEWLCYMAVPLIASLPRRLRLCVPLVISAACGCVGVVLFLTPPERQIVFYGASLHYVLVEIPLFLVGGLFGMTRTQKSVLGRPDLCLLFFVLNFGVSAWFGWWSLPIEWLTLPYMVISFGLLSLPVISRVARFGDLSYGMSLARFSDTATHSVKVLSSYPVTDHGLRTIHRCFGFPFVETSWRDRCSVSRSGFPGICQPPEIG